MKILMDVDTGVVDAGRIPLDVHGLPQTAADTGDDNFFDRFL